MELAVNASEKNSAEGDGHRWRSQEMVVAKKDAKICTGSLAGQLAGQLTGSRGSDRLRRVAETSNRIQRSLCSLLASDSGSQLRHYRPVEV